MSWFDRFNTALNWRCFFGFHDWYKDAQMGLHQELWKCRNCGRTDIRFVDHDV